MSKRSIMHTKPEEPNFVKKPKQQVGYQEDPPVDTKREDLGPAEDLSDPKDEQPQVVVLETGDLTAEEASPEKERLERESMDPQQSNCDGQELHNKSGGSTHSNPPTGKPHKKLGTSNFVALLGTKDESYYIDKTGLIEEFFNCDSDRVLVTGPRRFGKTVNIDMFKAFFELQLTAKEIKALSKKEFQEKIRETDNYKLFQDHELTITQDKDLMEKHFGKYPVIHISFRCEDLIQSFDDAISFYKSAISKAFKKHRYLQYSTALYSDEQNVCTRWVKKEWDINTADGRRKISEGLQTLVVYLCRHFTIKVVLLVDEYDSVMTRAMLDLTCVDELDPVIKFCTGIIKAAVKEDARRNWIEYAFITGISHISGMGLSGSNIKPFRFLGAHPFVPYYGLFAEEAEKLLDKTYGFNKEEIEVAKKEFNGYTSKSKHKVYNMWSLITYAGKRKGYEETCHKWQDTGCIVGLKEAFRFPAIKEKIETELLMGQPIKVEEVKNFRVRDLLNLVKIIREFDGQKVDCPPQCTDLFFSFILEQGYLSYVADKPGQLVIPNQQIKKEFEKKLRDYNLDVFKGDFRNLTDNCRKFLLKISEKTCDHNDFVNFQVNFQTLVQNYRTTWLKQNEENLRCTISLLVSDLGFTVSGELTFSFKDVAGRSWQRRIDYILTKDDFVMIMEFRYKKNNKEATLCIEERQYCKVFEDKNIIPRSVNHYVLMGINMDEHGNVSIGYLQNSKNFAEMKLIPS